jgi:hypothetical protein
MGFSTQNFERGRQERPWKVHPVWRGIGCILLLIIPIMSWYATTLFLRSNTKVVLPPELIRVVVIPTTKVIEVDKVIIQVNHYFNRVHFVFGQIFFTVIFSVIGFGVLSFLYAIVYRVAGPPRYGPFDVPPSKV